MDAITQLLAELHLRMADIVAGGSGGVVYAYLLKKYSTLPEVSGCIVVGILSAAYTTESVAHYALQYVWVTDGTVAFVMGLCGMTLCKIIIMGAQRWRPESLHALLKRGDEKP